MQTDRGLGGIDPDREVVGHDFEDIARDLARIGDVVGQRLRIGDQYELPMGVLQLETSLQGSDVMAEMERTGTEVGFVQALRWQGVDGTPVLDEERILRLSSTDERFNWTWRTRLVSLRDNVLAMSPWSMANAQGTKVSYHGLGFRLRRDFSAMGGNTVLLDGRPSTFAGALGVAPASAVTFIGSIDEYHPVPRVALTLRQAKPGALFILENPFAWLSAGPSNLAPASWPRGHVWEQAYTFTISDTSPIAWVAQASLPAPGSRAGL